MSGLGSYRTGWVCRDCGGTWGDQSNPGTITSAVCLSTACTRAWAESWGLDGDYWGEEIR